MIGFVHFADFFNSNVVIGSLAFGQSFDGIKSGK